MPSSLLPTSSQDRPRPSDFWRIWESRRVRLVSFALAAVCFLLLLSTTTGPRFNAPAHPPWPPPDFGFDDDVSQPPRPPRPPPFDIRPPLDVRPPPLDTRPPPPQSPTDSVWSKRAEQVKAAFVRGYSAYERLAYPHDELMPLTDGTKDPLNKWAATMVDSIDTMVLMGLDELSNRSVAHVANMTFHEDQSVQFFETVIRYLGGMLTAYALTNEPVFLSRADDLGQALLPIFNTTLGIPPFRINLKTGKGEHGWMGNVAILSEMASCQMEYRYLAHLTGRPEYVKQVDFITTFLRTHEEKNGLFALSFSLTNGLAYGTSFSVGARADSAYEYLLKQWLLTNKTEPLFLSMYLRSATAIIENMLYLSPRRTLLYVTDVHRLSLAPVGDLQHLSCFLAGLFALGAATIPDVDPRHAWAAEGLAHTCWVTYADTPTGLGPESVVFRGDSVGERWVDAVSRWEASGGAGVPPGVRDATPVKPGKNTEYDVVDRRYLLRPETIESFYILWRTTGDTKWRDRGWAVFEAIETHARVKDTYASVQDVTKVPAPQADDLPSFFFAETLENLYLLFTDEDKIPLDKWVFNTEAHPFPIFSWAPWEKQRFGIN